MNSAYDEIICNGQIELTSLLDVYKLCKQLNENKIEFIRERKKDFWIIIKIDRPE